MNSKYDLHEIMSDAWSIYYALTAECPDAASRVSFAEALKLAWARNPARYAAKIRKEWNTTPASEQLSMARKMANAALRSYEAKNGAFLRSSIIELDDIASGAWALMQTKLATLELAQQRRNRDGKPPLPLRKQDRYSDPILKLSVKDNHITKNERDITNSYLKATRYKYWDALLNNPEFNGKLTSDMQKAWKNHVDELANYDFTPFNIQTVAVEMNAQIFTGVEQAIMKVFDQFTVEHCWYQECKANTHYYNGWAHNKAHKINTKVIIPSYGLFSDYSWAKDTFKVYEAYNHLADIERCFNYLDGHTTAEVDLHGALQIANNGGVTRNIHCKFFDVTFYKKGTTHIKFTNQKLLDKFNIYCSRKRNWLPPCYGRSSYKKIWAARKRLLWMISKAKKPMRKCCEIPGIICPRHRSFFLSLLQYKNFLQFAGTKRCFHPVIRIEGVDRHAEPFPN